MARKSINTAKPGLALDHAAHEINELVIQIGSLDWLPEFKKNVLLNLVATTMKMVNLALETLDLIDTKFLYYQEGWDADSK